MDNEVENYSEQMDVIAKAEVTDDHQDSTIKAVKQEPGVVGIYSRLQLQQKMVTIKKELENALINLDDVWDVIGVEDEDRTRRVDLVFMYLSDLISEMVVEEEKRRDLLTENIVAAKQELHVICDELNVSPREINATKLMKQEQEIVKELEMWSREKNDRLSRVEQLKKVEKALIDKMYCTPMYIPTGAVPTIEQIEALQKRTDELALEKARRFADFCSQREQLTHLFEDLDEEITLDFHQDVLLEDIDSFVLSEHNMTELNRLLDEMKMKHTERKAEVNTLHNRVQELWDRLEIPEMDRTLFSSKIVNISKQSIKMYKTEIQRLENMKLEHMQEFIRKIRDELVTWWNKCYYSKSQRDFTGLQSEEFTEEVLARHEKALAEVKAFYHENEAMLQKVEKRRELWNRMLVLEEKEHDPSRYKNRGGNLLAEEKEKKKIINQLPKLEEQLKSAIEEWEKDNDKQFRIGGVQFFDFCRNQWEEYKSEKELARQQRMEQRERDTKNEIRYGSKPTPNKRRIVGGQPTCLTPKSRKLINDTHGLSRMTTRYGSMTHLNSVFTTPAPPTKTPNRTPAPRTPALRTPQSARKPPVCAIPVRGGSTPRTPLCSRAGTADKKTTASTSKLTKAVSERNISTARHAGGSGAIKKFKSERRLDLENAGPAFSSGEVMSSSGELESIVSSYDEFTNVLHSAKKKDFRSSALPKK